MKAQKLPSGSYRVQLLINGERLSFTAPTEDEAIYEAMAYKTNHKALKKHLPTLGKCIDSYIENKSNILSPSTIDGYKCIRKNSLAAICDIQLDKLTSEDIQRHMNTLALDHSPKTVRNAHGLLVAVINVYAPELRIRTTLPKPKKTIKQLPEVSEVIQAIIGSSIELPCFMALWLGMRMSEIRGAKKSDIKDNVLTIHSTVITVDGKHIEKDMTKTTESTRQITLPEHVKRLINALPQEQVYLTTLSGQAIYKRFSRLLEANGIAKMSFHDLRHMNASVMVALGIPDKYAMERGGWSSPNIMKSVYQHTFTAERQEVDNRIDDFFNNILHTNFPTQNK